MKTKKEAQISKTKAPVSKVQRHVIKIERADKPSRGEEVDVTISSVARSMILNGSTNDQVGSALEELFSVDREKHGYYPSWYRAQLVRQGRLSKKRANATRR